MVQTILVALWFFLPAGVANMMATVAAKLPVIKHWNAPMDFGVSWRGKRLLGDHKTWRGLLAGVVSAVLTLAGQQFLVTHTAGFDFFVAGVPGYASLPVLVLGLLFGLGALGGDAVKSFFKRRRGAKPGETWLVFDQVDSILGAELLTMPVIILSLPLYVAAAVLFPLLTVAVTFLAHRLRIKDEPI